MSLLELCPASRRLRQAARAHAAGEISRPAYRRLRGEIIEELDTHYRTAAVGRTGTDPDETRRRLSGDVPASMDVLESGYLDVPERVVDVPGRVVPGRVVDVPGRVVLERAGAGNMDVPEAGPPAANQKWWGRAFYGVLVLLVCLTAGWLA